MPRKRKKAEGGASDPVRAGVPDPGQAGTGDAPAWSAEAPPSSADAPGAPAPPSPAVAGLGPEDLPEPRGGPPWGEPAAEDPEHYRIAALDPGPRTLSIDVGGSAVKAAVLNSHGARLGPRQRLPTPHPAPPEVVLDLIEHLARDAPPFDRVSIGFPGAVRRGRTQTAPNLDDEAWRGFDLAGALRARLGRPARVLNDAEVQGLAAVEGRGLEMVITLGTGFGFGLFEDGRPAPHLEMAHHAFRRDETYEEQLGDRALKRIGKRKWNKRLARAIASLRHLANFDRLYIGGGNARHVELELDADVTLVSNEAGIQGGIALWRDEDEARRAWLESGGSPEVL